MREVEATSVRPTDRHQEIRVEDQVESLVRKLQPSKLADQRRSAVFQYVRHVVKKQLPGCEVFSVGSFPLKTYLPCADVDMVMFLPRGTVKSDTAGIQCPGAHGQHKRPGEAQVDPGDVYNEKSGASDLRPTPPLVTVNQALCMVATKRGGRRGGDGPSRYMASSEQKSNPEIRNVSFINARTPMVTMLVGNVVVDLTENQAGSVAASVLLEEADRFIQRDHLFKRSLLLLKAWALCETPRLVGQRVLGAREGGLTSYGLSIMVLHLFCSKQSADKLMHPLDVFIRFFEVFAEFDWTRHCLTLDGPVTFEEVRDCRLGGHRGEGTSNSLLWSLVDRVMAHLSTSTDEAESIKMRGTARSGRQRDGQGGTPRAPTTTEVESSVAHFPVRHCNIQDPLNSLNNLGHSVSRRSLKALEYALRQGRQLLENCDLMPGVDAQKRVTTPDTVGAEPTREMCPSPADNGAGGREGVPSERDTEDRTARLMPQQAVPLVTCRHTSISPVVPRQLFAPVPLVRPPPPPIYSGGVLMGSSAPVHVASPHHLDASGSQQLRLAQSQSLLQLPTPMYQFVYYPYMITEGRAAPGPAASIPRCGQTRPHSRAYVPSTLLHGQQLPRFPFADFQYETLHGHEQQNSGVADVLLHEHASRAVHQPSEDKTMMEPRARAQTRVWASRMTRPSYGIEHLAPTDKAERDYPEQDLHGVERIKHLDDGRSRHNAMKPTMLPWNPPAFSTSPTSSTTSMSEYTEEVSKEDQDRQLPHENGVDDNPKGSAGKALRSSRLWQAVEAPISSTSDSSSGASGGIDLGRSHDSVQRGGYGGGGKRPRKSLDTGSNGKNVGADEGLWKNWFLRQFFPQCCQLYGSGDGFREDLLDHPCQHWSSLQRSALTPSEEDCMEILEGASSEMWSTLEAVGPLVRGMPQGISGESREGNAGQATWGQESCMVTNSSGSKDGVDDREGHQRQELDMKAPAVEVTTADYETGSTTSEEQGDRQRNCSRGDEAKASSHQLLTPAVPSSCRSSGQMKTISTPPFMSATRPASAVAWTQTDDYREPRCTEAEVGVQCALPRTISTSRGTQCDGSRKMVSTKAQCTLQILEHTSVPGDNHALPEFVERTSAGTQCFLPPTTPKTADIGVGTDPVPEPGSDELSRKSKVKLPQATSTSTFDPEENQDIDHPSGTWWLTTAPRLPRLDSLMMMLPKCPPVTFITGATRADLGIVGQATPHAKKHKRRKNKVAVRCASESSTLGHVEVNGCEESDAKSRMSTPLLQTSAKRVGGGYIRWAWWKVVSSGGITSCKRGGKLVILCAALFLSMVGVLLVGEGTGNTVETHPPLESVRARGDVEHRVHPPMWVMAGGSLTLGDVMAGRIEGAEFQWVKDGEVLPGRTSSFLSITGATLEDEGTYSCFSARATGAARLSPVWEEATVRVSEPPTVESQLQTQRLARGEMLAIVATASGVPQPQYQWRRNGVPIPGATRPMLVRHSVTEADMGTYTCDVYNVAGSVRWEEMAVILREDTNAREARSKRRYMFG